MAIKLEADDGEIIHWESIKREKQVKINLNELKTCLKLVRELPAGIPVCRNLPFFEISINLVNA